MQDKILKLNTKSLLAFADINKIVKDPIMECIRAESKLKRFNNSKPYRIKKGK